MSDRCRYFEVVVLVERRDKKRRRTFPQLFASFNTCQQACHVARQIGNVFGRPAFVQEFSHEALLSDCYRSEADIDPA